MTSAAGPAAQAAFVDVGAGLPALANSAAAWGDFDNDGQLDVILVGFENLVGDRLELLRNENGTFTKAATGLPAVAYGTPAWGDFDNDGDLDLALLVEDPITFQYATELWRNDGQMFVRHSSVPVGAASGQMVWADYDADGDLDLFFTGPSVVPCPLHIWRNDRGTMVDKLAGINADIFAVADYDGDGDADVVAQSGSELRLWRNDEGTFIDANVSFSGLIATCFAWGDYDNDGDLDLLVCGRDGSGPSAQNVVRLFRSDGGNFTRLVLPSLSGAASKLTWGDFDNDGRLDLAGVMVDAGAPSSYSGLWRNSSAGLVDSGIQFPFQFTTTAAWADYDNDGNLDLLLGGGLWTGNLTNQLLRNVALQTNSPPSAPFGLSALISGTAVTLTWKPAADAQTVSSGLTYNLRIGRSPGALDVMSPQADLRSGRRRLAQMGNAPTGTRARLLLPAGTYYWSVQAVDSAFAGGRFSAESTFTVIAQEPGVKAEVASALKATEATLNAEVDPRGLSTTVHFEWGTTIAYGQSSSPQTVTGTSWTTVTQTVTGLQIGSVYHFRVVASSGGSTVFSSDRSFTTRLFVPGPDLAEGTVVRSHVWGDYENDGDLDVLIGSFDLATGGSSAQLWRNNSGTFAAVSTGLPAIDDTMAWGDYDRDGHLDLVLSGWAAAPGPAGYITQIWRSSKGRLANINAGLPGSDGWVTAWGDFDNDGDLDLLLTGHTLPAQSIQIWRNDSGSFVQVPIHFPGLANPQAFWADLDQDGDLDLLIMGAGDSGSVTALYRNDDGVYSPSDQVLTGFQQGDVAFGDYDNDGDLDLAIAGIVNGASGLGEMTLQIWRNDKGVFTLAADRLASLQDPKLAWGDYDNDGDLDLIVSGSQGGADVAKLFRNDQNSWTEVDTGLRGRGPVSWADYDQDGDLDLLIGGQIWRNEGQSSNSPPSAPTELRAFLSDGQLVFSWNPAVDSETPSAALSYNLRVGSRAGQQDVLAAQADLITGTGRLPRRGPVQGTKTFLSALALPLGTYYWSVQAVDSGLAGGLFAPEATVVFNSGAPLVGGLAATAGTSTAEIRGQVHPRGLVTSIWLDWGKTADYGQRLTLADCSGPAPVQVEASLARLEVETGYHCRLVATNLEGVTYGPDQTFTTRRFTPLDITMGSVKVSAAQWGDFDRDGDPDLVICGITEDGPVTQIWRNDRWLLTPMPTQLPGISSGTVAWGDFDHDVQLDLLICGDGLTQIWRDDAGTFKWTASLPGLTGGTAAWGDYDNDGDLDVLLSGWDGTSDITAVWRNDSGIFVPSGIELPQLSWPHASWVDYDQDGDLDLLFIGADLDPASAWQTSATELWRNDNGTFVKTTLDLPAFGIGSAAWGDYDGDGDLDLALCFETKASQIQRNQDGRFVDTGARLPALARASMSWGDYDGDGDLDLVIAGQSPFGPVQQIWRNEKGTFLNTDTGFGEGVCVAWADFDQDGDLDLLVGGRIWRNDGHNLNVPPAAPVGLSHAVTANRVDFSWSPSTDGQTPTTGLAYNFRLEASAANRNGAGPAGAAGTVSSGFNVCAFERSTTTFLTVPNGLYYWTVQALNSASLPGPWAPERVLIVSPDSDQDGLPDLWELAHGLDPNSAADGADDADGDGVSNLQEFAAGTDPNDASSLLTITALEPEGLDLLLSFSTARGRSYRLEQSLTSSKGPWASVLQDIPGTGEEASLRIAGGLEQANAFYRVTVEP